MLLDEVIDVGNGRTDEKRKDEGDNVMSTRPDVYVNRVEHGQEWEAPSDSINDDVLAGISELVDEVSEKQEVNEGPDEEGPVSGRYVCFLRRAVYVSGTSYSVHIGSEEEEKDENVDNLRGLLDLSGTKYQESIEKIAWPPFSTTSPAAMQVP